LEIAGKNYKAGLDAVRRVLTEYLLTRAQQFATLPQPGTGKTQTVDEILRKYWGRQLNMSYHIAEGFRTNFALEAGANIPFELYFLVFDIFKEFNFEETLVFRPADQFKSETFEETILEPLDSILQVGKQTILPGTLEQPPVPRDLRTEIQLKPANAIWYVSGEAHNPILWPLIIHESFHLLDNRLGLFQEMESLMGSTKKLPVLDPAKIEQVNKKWSKEIFQDIAAVHYFGPMYAFSLMNYFERLPYIRSVEHPEMSSRLYAVNKYLQTAHSQHTDYLTRALSFCKPLITRELARYEQSGELSDEVKTELDMFYDAVASWLRSRRITLFTDRLARYVAQGSRAREMVDKQIIDRVPYVDPIFTFDEVVDLVFTKKVSLALDPTLLLNVVLAVSDKYTPQGYSERLVDCMYKCRVKQAWDLALSSIKA
jgi:hypothetical protein